MCVELASIGGQEKRRHWGRMWMRRQNGAVELVRVLLST